MYDTYNRTKPRVQLQELPLPLEYGFNLATMADSPKNPEHPNLELLHPEGLHHQRELEKN